MLTKPPSIPQPTGGRIVTNVNIGNHVNAGQPRTYERVDRDADDAAVLRVIGEHPMGARTAGIVLETALSYERVRVALGRLRKAERVRFSRGGQLPLWFVAHER